MKAVAGDGLYIYVEWDSKGSLKSESIHQYGSATQNEASPHYNDQMNLYVEEEMKNTFFFKSVKKHTFLKKKMVAKLCKQSLGGYLVQKKQLKSY